ncbi:MAG: hypothetical protein AAFX90_19610 [Pseudomonadota bacterium]
MPARKFSDEILEKAAALREQGMTFRQIESETGVPHSVAYFHCLRLGADSPATATDTRTPGGPMQYTRGNHEVRRFTPAEDEHLLQLELSGMRICDIARKIGRKENSIRGRLMLLARKEARAERAAELEAGI